jgi:hypothetical protein
MSTYTNEERARRVADSLGEFYEEDNVVDLITDIMHFCEREGIDFYKEFSMARMHFEAEQQS